MNDLSARPAPNGTIAKTEPTSIILNTLGDLTNRENRAFAPRFGNDFRSRSDHERRLGPGTRQQGRRFQFRRHREIRRVTAFPTTTRRSIPASFSPLNNSALIYELKCDSATGNLVSNPATRCAVNTEAMAFPYIFPGAYSMPEPGTRQCARRGLRERLDPLPQPRPPQPV